MTTLEEYNNEYNKFKYVIDYANECEKLIPDNEYKEHLESKLMNVKYEVMAELLKFMAIQPFVDYLSSSCYDTVEKYIESVNIFLKQKINNIESIKLIIEAWM